MFYVYRFLNRDGIVIYVGQTSDWVKRLEFHRKNWWFMYVKSIEVDLRRTRRDALDWEASQIASYSPTFNIQQNRPTSFGWDGSGEYRVGKVPPYWEATNKELREVGISTNNRSRYYTSRKDWVRATDRDRYYQKKQNLGL